MYLDKGTLLQEGKYKIVRFIGAGGFGCTYEAIDTFMETRVAIKEFFVRDFCVRDNDTSRITLTNPNKRELLAKLRGKFIEEARAIFKMRHDNIVRVNTFFEENGTAYYVMEYIDGCSLSDILKKRGSLSETEMLEYIRQIASALKYVHQQNRLHLDIKPANILVDNTGKAILIDFGASKHYDEGTGENTTTMQGLNTPGYAPYEQTVEGITEFKPASDIYALGATMYKLLTGETPPNSGLLIMKKQTLSPLPEYISVATRNAIYAAMQLQDVDRPQSIDDLLDLLDSKEEEDPEKTAYDGDGDTVTVDIEKSFFGKIKAFFGDNIKAISGLAAVVLLAVVASLILPDRCSTDSIVEDNDSAKIAENPSSVDLKEHEWVDLGLSVKWATCNVGASKPEEYGNYYAWGETSPKTTYDCSTYKWCKDSSSSTSMTKYCTSSSSGTVDNKTTLELADDAARANWGGSWRMPTKVEQDELLTKCTWTWTSQGGVNGYKVTSNTNGNSIFLPAAGYRYEGSLFNAGSYGVYWSSSLNSGYPNGAYYLYFNSGSVDWNYNDRCYGQSVRAVCP